MAGEESPRAVKSEDTVDQPDEHQPVDNELLAISGEESPRAVKSEDTVDQPDEHQPVDNELPAIAGEESPTAVKSEDTVDQPAEPQACPSIPLEVDTDTIAKPAETDKAATQQPTCADAPRDASAQKPSSRYSRINAAFPRVSQ
eukprot:2881155-Amphidinium_carterae.1